MELKNFFFSLPYNGGIFMENKIDLINIKLDFLLKEFQNIDRSSLSYEERRVIVKKINTILIKLKITKKYEKELLDKINERI